MRIFAITFELSPPSSFPPPRGKVGKGAVSTNVAPLPASPRGRVEESQLNRARKFSNIRRLA